MNARKASSRASGWFSGLSSTVGPVLAVLGVTLIGGIGTFAFLSYAGFFNAAPTGPSRVGLVPVARSVRPIKAYTKIRREDVYDRNLGDDSYYWMPPERVKANPDWIANVADVIGRVLRTDKEEGYVFSEKNFLPEGTRPGVVGGIPPGKRSLTVPVNGVPGLDLLNAGDQFDLLIASSASQGRSSGVELAALLGGVKPPELRIGQRASSGGVRVLVHQGMLVELTSKPVSDSRNSANSSSVATVAVNPEEVASLAEALARDEKIFCVAHSGQPDDDAAADAFDSMVAVPVLSRSIPAFTRITESDLADAATGRLNLYYFKPEQLDEDWLLEAKSLIGRVVSRELPQGHLFTSDDLMPEGTRAGIAAAAAPGKRVYVAPRARIKGLDGLSVGDEVAIYATLGDAVSAPPAKLDWASIMGGIPEPEGIRLQDEVRAGVRSISRNAQIVSLNSSDGSVAFAIEAEEVISLSQAVNSGSEIFAVAVSSRSNEADVEGLIRTHRAHGVHQFVSNAISANRNTTL